MHPVKSFGTCSNGRMYGRRFTVGRVRGKRGVDVDLTCWQQVWVVLHRIQQVVRRADVTHPAVLHGPVTFVGFLSIVQVNTTKSSPPGHRDVKIDQLGFFSTTFKPPLPQPPPNLNSSPATLERCRWPESTWSTHVGVLLSGTESDRYWFLIRANNYLHIPVIFRMSWYHTWRETPLMLLSWSWFCAN